MAKDERSPLLERLRKFCLSLPETTEVERWGHPNFRVGGKTFAVFELYRGRPSIAAKSEVALQEMLIDDERFFRTPYIGHLGWISVWVDRPLEWAVVRELVAGSYRRMAPRRPAKEGKNPGKPDRGSRRPIRR